MFTVVVYKSDGGWFMDDAAKGIVAEPLILGMPDIIEHIVGGNIYRFTAIFSPLFSGENHVLMRQEPENDGYWYELKGSSMRGWLCPVLFQYFDEAPLNLYISWQK